MGPSAKSATPLPPSRCRDSQSKLAHAQTFNRIATSGAASLTVGALCGAAEPCRQTRPHCAQDAPGSSKRHGAAVTQKTVHGVERERRRWSLARSEQDAVSLGYAKQSIRRAPALAPPTVGTPAAVGRLKVQDLGARAPPAPAKLWKDAKR